MTSMGMDTLLPVIPVALVQDAGEGAPAAVLGGGGDAGSTTTATGDQALGDTGAVQRQDPFGGPFIFLLLGMFGLMIFMTVMQGRKEKKRKAELMSGMTRRDEVRTLGGMIGTIVEMKDDRVRIQIDESTKARVWVSKTAVESILRKGGEPANDEPVATDAA